MSAPLNQSEDESHVTYIENPTSFMNFMFDYYRDLCYDDPAQAIGEINNFINKRSLPLPAFYDVSFHYLLAKAHYNIDDCILALGEIDYAKEIYRTAKLNNVEATANAAWDSLEPVIAQLYDLIVIGYEDLRLQEREFRNGRVTQKTQQTQGVASGSSGRDELGATDSAASNSKEAEDGVPVIKMVCHDPLIWSDENGNLYENMTYNEVLDLVIAEQTGGN